MGMAVEIGKGIGEVRFGLSEEQVVARFGDPDAIIPGDDPWFLYYAMHMGLQLEQGNEDRLGWIRCTHPDMTLFGARVMRRRRADLLELTSEYFLHPERDDDIAPSDIFFENEWLNLELTLDHLTGIGLGVLYDDDDNPLWPNDPHGITSKHPMASVA